jgi:hypothetical protein
MADRKLDITALDNGDWQGIKNILDELVRAATAASRGTTTWLTRDGMRIGAIVPADTAEAGNMITNLKKDPVVQQVMGNMFGLQTPAGRHDPDRGAEPGR